jgi:hypothetical protein
MIIISIDVATKSLAVAVLRYNNVGQEIDDLINKSTECSGTLSHRISSMLDSVEKSIDLVDNSIKLLHLEVVNLIGDKRLKDTDAVYRAKRLREYLESLDKVIKPVLSGNTRVLVEYQMGPNDKSRSVSSQLVYHFSGYGCEIHLVGPSIKNTVCIGGKDCNRFRWFIERYKTNYSANKAHSRKNLLEFLDGREEKDMLDGISKKNYDDAGDAVLMALGWLIKNLRSLC